MCKKKVLISIITLCCVFISLIFFGRTLPSRINLKDINNKESYLNINKDLFYRQTINNCGPYSVMAVINVLTDENEDPEKLSKEIKWRIDKNLTFPQGVIDLLRKYKISTKEKVLKNCTDAEKVTWLKNNIENGTPVILLIKIHHILHYITVVGYNEKGFMLYDSMQNKLKENQRKTVIDKDCVTGNRFYTNEELIGLWNDGGYKIFFKNWAIVCYKK